MEHSVEFIAGDERVELRKAALADVYAQYLSNSLPAANGSKYDRDLAE